MSRSVELCAKFNKETNMTQKFPVPQRQVTSIEQFDVEEMSNTNGGSFESTIEIERAYLWPMVEKVEKKTGSPSTYVTFLTAVNSADGRGSNFVSNVCLRTCTSKWDSKFSTRLSRELVHNVSQQFFNNIKFWMLSFG